MTEILWASLGSDGVRLPGAHSCDDVTRRDEPMGRRASHAKWSRTIRPYDEGHADDACGCGCGFGCGVVMMTMIFFVSS